MDPQKTEDPKPYVTVRECILGMKLGGQDDVTPYYAVTRHISYMMSKWLTGTTEDIPSGSRSHYNITPICLYSASHAQILEKELRKNFNVQLTYSPEVYEGFKVQIDSEESYSKIVAILRRKRIPFNDFHWRQDYLLRVVLYGISGDFSMEQVNYTMLKMGYPLISLYRRKNAIAVNGVLPIFVDVLKTNPGMQILKLQRFMSSDVTVTLFEKRPCHTIGIPNVMNICAVKIKNCTCLSFTEH